MSNARRLISVVTPCFNEEQAVAACVGAVRDVFERELPQYEYEHLFIDNASRDGTVGVLRDIAREDSHVRVIVNARNFGPFQSVFHALMQARGDGVVALLPADLQDPPELIPQMVAHWERGCGVVYGIRERREENSLLAWARRVYYRLAHCGGGVDVPRDAGEFQLLDRAVIEALRQCDDAYPYIRGLIAHCGFPRAGIAYTQRRRAAGRGKNRVHHMIDQALNGLISLNRWPVRACWLSGLILMLFAALGVVVGMVMGGDVVGGMILAMMFFAGIQLFFLGVVGEYVAAIHAQVRRRPLVVERERINFD